MTCDIQLAKTFLATCVCMDESLTQSERQAIRQHSLQVQRTRTLDGWHCVACVKLYLDLVVVVCHVVVHAFLHPNLKVLADLHPYAQT